MVIGHIGGQAMKDYVTYIEDHTVKNKDLGGSCIRAKIHSWG
jgi:hypothetical protein